MVQAGERLPIDPETGEIDAPRLGALCDHLVGQPVEICDVVLCTLTGELPWLTPSRLSAKVQRLVMAADTQSAAERHALARTRRRVSAPRLLPDGMASLSVTAPLLDVALIDTAVEAMARAARRATRGRLRSHGGGKHLGSRRARVGRRRDRWRGRGWLRVSGNGVWWQSLGWQSVPRRWAVPGATPDPGLAPWEPVRDGVSDSRRTPPDTAAAPRRSQRSNDTPMRPLRLPGGGNPVAAVKSLVVV